MHEAGMFKGATHALQEEVGQNPVEYPEYPGRHGRQVTSIEKGGMAVGSGTTHPAEIPQNQISPPHRRRNHRRHRQARQVGIVGRQGRQACGSRAGNPGRYSEGGSRESEGWYQNGR